MKNEEALEVIGEDTEVIDLRGGTVAAIVKSEVEAQLDAAHRYPRSIRKFLNDATTLATFNLEVAMSCIYSLPRSGKSISGPSVRLAEICASAYGNLHIGTRVVGVEEKNIIAQGLVWDLEKNLKWAVEVRRRITDRNGRQFNDDMQTVTGNAAASIAARNAIFRAIPKAYVNAVYEKAKEVAIGNASTLSARRATVIERLSKMGALQERILARVEKPSVEDITLDDLELLIGIGTAIKNGDQQVDDAFPAKVEATKGTLDVSQLKPGKEENRGHGNENLQATNGKQACDKADFDGLEILATENGITNRVWRQHIEKTMGIAAWDALTKDRLPEVQAYIRTQKKP